MASSDFNLSEELCYLNHAAVSPWPQRTVEAVQRFAEENATLGAYRYPEWLKVEQGLRSLLRELVNASSEDEIALLKNTSEALSVIAGGIDWKPGDEVVISDQEFPSNRIVWESLQPLGVSVKQVDISGAAPEQALLAALTGRTRLLSISSVQYSTGLALHLETLGSGCRQAGVAFCVDAIQSLGVKPFDVQTCQADFVVADGHKWMLGPEGVALFFCRRDWIPRLTLRQFGWHMVEASGQYDRADWTPARTARRFECGSPNMLGIHALHASLTLLLETGVSNIYQSISGKVQFLIDSIEKNGGIILSAREPQRRAGIVTYRLPDEDPKHRFDYLMHKGVVCALRGGGIRFSPHFYTPEQVLRRALSLTFQPIK